MTPGKRLTIGVTVNLERYENLRVAVEGDVETVEDAENLARYLDNVLAGFGKNDPETKKQITNYRFRVLPGRGDAAGDVMEVAEAAEAAEAAMEPEEEPVMHADLVSDEEAPMVSQSDSQKGDVIEIGDSGNGCTPSRPSLENKGLVCADCGASISRQEYKLGRLFVDRPLCRSCLETLQKAQQD